MKFAIVDTRVNFTSDIENRLAINDDSDVEVVAYLPSMDKLSDILGKVDTVLLADNVLEQPTFFIPNISTYAYQTSREDNGTIGQKGLNNIGFIKSAKDMVNKLMSFDDVVSGFQNNMQQPMMQNPQNMGGFPQQGMGYPQQGMGYPQQGMGGYPNMPYGQQMPQQGMGMPQMGQDGMMPQQVMGGYPNMPYGQQGMNYPQGAFMGQQMPQQGMGMPQMGQNGMMPQQMMNNMQMNGMQTEAPASEDNAEEEEIENVKPVKKSTAEKNGIDKKGSLEKVTTDISHVSDSRNEIPDKAKVVTVYSAKGGVGKTTLSSELAAYLALTCKKRGRLRVCVVDYNIDFGDVMTTLGFDPEGINMCLWASEISERLEKGESTEYTAKDIEDNFLQCKSFADGIELHALLAPPNHEDSMLVSEDALNIMLKNLVENGGFDYVICDTGNNTRDSSIIALDYADFIFLVVTQDITTINCNDSFLTTMRKMEFDESRIRVVINNIASAKETAISIHDIESFVNFPCIAHIKRNTDVIKANNQSVPLVFKSNHEFTKELRKIVSFVINDGEIVVEEKKGFSLFRRNSDGTKEKKGKKK